jgi:hypothetical protein
MNHRAVRQAPNVVLCHQTIMYPGQTIMYPGQTIMYPRANHPVSRGGFASVGAGRADTPPLQTAGRLPHQMYGDNAEADDNKEISRLKLSNYRVCELGAPDHPAESGEGSAVRPVPGQVPQGMDRGFRGP